MVGLDDLSVFSTVNDFVWKNYVHLLEIYLKYSFPRLLEQALVVFVGVLVATTTLKVSLFERQMIKKSYSVLKPSKERPSVFQIHLKGWEVAWFRACVC